MSASSVDRHTQRGETNGRAVGQQAEHAGERDSAGAEPVCGHECRGREVLVIGCGAAADSALSRTRVAKRRSREASSQIKAAATKAMTNQSGSLHQPVLRKKSSANSPTSAVEAIVKAM